MFKSFGLPELLIILVIVLLIFGAGRLPQIGGAIGKSIKEFRKEKEAVPEKAAVPAVQAQGKPQA